MLSVQTNMGANTALKNINTNSVNMNKSLERLSSGFRINNAADDAAGFAVSSKLDAQTSRLKAASLNASQAQAMVKMADAGVNEIQNMTTRIQTLAIQASSANNAGELGKLDAERIKLESAINKIANSTNFNGVNLLNASSGTVTAGTVATSGTVTAANNGTATTAVTGAPTFSEAASFSVVFDAAGNITSVKSDVALHSAADGSLLAAAGAELAGAAGVAQTFAGVTLTSTPGATPAAGTETFTTTAGTAATRLSSFQVGADNNANNQVDLNLANSYTTASLGLGTGDLTTQANAQAYITTSKAALDTIVTQRADLGATQNQVAFVQANLATSIEQTTASVSSIRDADMAAEMADFTKNKILTQASTSMLAQANQAAQNVLSLFR